MDLKRKVAVILGASGGIGSAIVKELSSKGVECIKVTRNEVDLRELEKVQDFSGKLAKLYPRIDIFINASGVGVYEDIEDLTVKGWEDSLAVNVTGPLFFVKELISSLDHKGAVVINLGSGLGKRAYYKKRLPYITSKFALRGLSLALSKDFKGKSPDFVLVSLGSVFTDFGPGGKKRRFELQKRGKLYFTPEWVAERIVNIVRDEGRQMEYTFYPEDYIKG